MGRCSSSASTYRNEACPATPAARRPRAPLGARPKVVLSRRSVPTFCPDRVADRAQRPQRPPEGSSARARRPLGARPKVCARRSQRRRPGSESRPSGHCSSSERHIGAPGPSSPPATTVSSSRRGPGGSFATRARVPRHRERKNQRHRNGGNAPRRHCVTGEVRCRVASSRRRSRLPPPAHVGSRRMLAATGRGPVQVRDSVGSRQNYLRAGADGHGEGSRAPTTPGPTVLARRAGTPKAIPMVADTPLFFSYAPTRAPRTRRASGWPRSPIAPGVPSRR